MWLIAIASVLLILLILIDAFEATVLPRQVMHRWRFARLYYRTTWTIWTTVALRLPSPKRRDAMLAWFGPLSLLGLFATWVIVLIFGFALLNWSLGTMMHSTDPARPEALLDFGSICIGAESRSSRWATGISRRSPRSAEPWPSLRPDSDSDSSRW